MADEQDVARAIAFFEGCDDAELMRRALAEAAPRARRTVERYVRRRGEARIPPPAEVPPADQPASAEEALATLSRTEDFGLLQALTRTIGRRVEELASRE
jgi:hypothetical protein